MITASITGSGRLLSGGSASGRAVARLTTNGSITAGIVSIRGTPTGMATVVAGRTERCSVYKSYKWLYVEPSADQEFVWVRCGSEVDYTVISNTEWRIE